MALTNIRERLLLFFDIEASLVSRQTNGRVCRTHRIAVSSESRQGRMNMLRLLIVDDEKPARERLKNLLSDLQNDLANCVVAEASDGVEALERLHQSPVDVALVDIRMPRLDGIELARHLTAMPQAPAVIFTTAFDQYAVKAFELSAIDYLLKPVRAARLLEALKKAQRLPADADAWRTLIAGRTRGHLHCTERGRVLLVPVADILYLRAELKYVTARTREREYLLEESLTHLEQEFAERFIRLHRNCLVARNAIAGCERTTADDGETLLERARRWPCRSSAGQPPPMAAGEGPDPVLNLIDSADSIWLPFRFRKLSGGCVFRRARQGRFPSGTGRVR